MASLSDNNKIIRPMQRISKTKKEVLPINEFLKKHKSQEVYFKATAISKEKKTNYLLTEKGQAHSKNIFNKPKKNSISPRMNSPKTKLITNSSKISPREQPKLTTSPNKDKKNLKLCSLEKIMSDNESCEEIVSEEEESNLQSNNSNKRENKEDIDDTEICEVNEFSSLKINETGLSISTNANYHITKFPTLSSNPFMNTKPIEDYTAKPQNEKITQLYRNLLILAKKGDKEQFLDTLEQILSNKGDINYKDEGGYSALHYACDEGNLKIVEILLKANCEVNIKTNEKKTPLHLTAKNGYFDISKLLIENGAIFNIGDGEKNTPLHLCALNGHVELMKFFLDKLPQADTKNIYGKTPLNLASKEEIKALLSNYLTKNDNTYHNIKIHTASESALNHMIKKFNGTRPVNKIMLQNTQNTIHINIQTNINSNNPDSGENRPRTKTVNASLGKSNQKGKSKPSSNTNFSSNIQKKMSIPNFPIKEQDIHKKNNITSSAGQNFHKTKTLQKFLTPKHKKEQNVNTNIQTNTKKTTNANNLSVDNKDGIYRLNKTEELAKPYKTNPNETSEEKYNQSSLNSIEEERITPTSFVCLAMLGRGSFGEVYLVQKISSENLYAMKVLNKDRIMGQNLMKYAMTERNVLSLTNHPFIVKLNFAFQTTHRLFLILDYCPGGDLAKHLQYEKKFTEERARFYICEVLLALEDLHKRDIIFRDLKPDNVVLDEDGHAKLTDFGLSKEGVFDSQSAKSFCGSLAYLAPEMLKKQGHGKAVDWYLLGVLFYEMLVGIPPFYTEQKEDIFRNIECGELIIPKNVSREAAEILRALLQRDPSKRLGSGPTDAEEIKKHRYFRHLNWDDIYNKRIPPPKVRNNVKNIQIYNHPRMFQADDQDLNSNLLSGWSFINNEDI